MNAPSIPAGRRLTTYQLVNLLNCRCLKKGCQLLRAYRKKTYWNQGMGAKKTRAGKLTPLEEKLGELVGCELLLGWLGGLSDPWLVSNQAHRVEDDDQDRRFVNEHPTSHVDVTVD